MKCMECGVEIEADDNFCWQCGHWTAKGYTFFQDKDNVKQVLKGDSIKQKERLAILLNLLCIGFIAFAVMMFIKGDDLFRPIVYLKKQVNSYIYGYNSSIIKTDNKYNKENINSYDEAINFIKDDFDKQAFMCYKNDELTLLEYNLEQNYAIPSVVLCDISLDEAKKINDVIEKMYNLFPNIKGTLTNITITNALTNSEYIARFQPMYQFVNINEDINQYNKVNKTQILLNSYYFLNEEMLKQPITNIVGENWYVNDATWESTIAHELGHYISFVIFLKEHNLKDITYVNQDNYELINNLMMEYDKGDFSQRILNEALINYNYNNNQRLDMDSFVSSISGYAGMKDDNGNLIFDEAIAEAIHDYYLHGNSMKLSSYEIVNVIKRKMGII